MNPDREARRPVVGEHPLPDRRLRQLGRGCCRIERERELLLLSTRTGNALGARNEAELPQELPARQAEAVARARDEQRLEAVLRQLRPLREVADARERPVALAFLDDGLRLVLADPVHVVDAD